MKPTTLIKHFSTLALTAILGLSGLSSLQAAVPELMTYQVYVTDADNAALADTEPTNYEVEFRIYDNSTGGNIVWAESQVVTLFQGNLSVLLGNGTELGKYIAKQMHFTAYQKTIERALHTARGKMS